MDRAVAWHGRPLSMAPRLASYLPDPIRQRIRSVRRRMHDRKFFAQGSTTMRCGDFTIEVPEQHLLRELVESQPLRDVNVGIAAEYLGAKYPDATILDIGANIGDTAAHIATHAANAMVLVEATDYYHEILRRNAEVFPNAVEIKKVFVSDGSTLSGTFRHWGGTAAFEEGAGGDAAESVETQRLDELAAGPTCLVKTDTDGYDFKILRAAIAWLADQRPGVLYEAMIRSLGDLEAADALVDELWSIGYRRAMVWDDAGLHLASTASPDVLKGLQRYLFKTFDVGGRIGIYNYDILCLHEADVDVFEQVDGWYREN